MSCEVPFCEDDHASAEEHYAGGPVPVRVERVIVREMREDDLGKKHGLPEPLLAGYEKILIAVYESTGAAGGRGAPRKQGLSKRAVIKNYRAFELKKNIDRKLRRIAADIERGLLGVDAAPERVNKCSKCKKIGLDEWRYCPRCGGQMTADQEG